MKQNNGCRLIEQTSQRFENQHEYFFEEYRSIHKRRSPDQEVNDSKPVNLTGIGFSGGGIKASAFHLGLLSGLHKAGLLLNIDYISSVSGGSWANGAYWAIHETDDSLFASLDTITGATYVDGDSLNQKEVKKKTREREIYEHKKYKILLPSSQDRFLGSRDWQRHIRSHYLFNDDINFSKFLEYDKEHLYSKPFPIFLATHTNKIFGLKDEENFPFEITPLGFGTVVDCKTEVKGKTSGFCRRFLRPHLWTYPPEKGFHIPFVRSSDIDVSVKKYIDEGDKGLYLSHAMWSSGGLIAKVLSLHLRISIGGSKVPGIKEKYVLSDGGKADNTGLTPLIERGVDLIILSQIAGDPDVKQGDMDKASKQVERLFGVDTKFQKQDNAPVIRKWAYGTDNEKSIIFIKPTPENIDAFFSSKYGSNQNIEALRVKLNDNRQDKNRFPQDKTLATEYPQETIYGYYLLGRFIGEQDLATSISDWRKERVISN